MNLKRRFLLYVVLAGAFAATTVTRAGVFENLETAEEAYLYAFPKPIGKLRIDPVDFKEPALCKQNIES